MSTLMASVIIAVLALGMAGFLVSLYSNSSNVKSRLQLENFHEELRSLFSSPAGCLNNLGGQNLVASLNYPLPNLRDETGAIKFTFANPYGDLSFEIVRASFSGYHDLAVPIGQGTLSVVYQPLQKNFPSVIRTIAIQTEKNGAGNLVKCLALAKMSDGIWRVVPSNLADIFFRGRVGIGNTQPTNAKLHVTGDSSTEPAILGFNLVSGAYGSIGGSGAPGTIVGVSGSTPDPMYAGVAGSNMVTGAQGLLGYQGIGVMGIVVNNAGTAVQGRNQAVGSEGYMANSYAAISGNYGVGGPSGAIATQTHGIFCGSGQCGGVGPWQNTSDIRLKKNIRMIQNGLDIISRLQGVSFDWRDSNRQASQGHSFGFIAQDVEKVLPDLVKVESGPQKLKSLSSTQLIAPMVEAIKELSRKEALLRSQIDFLQAENLELKRQFEHLEKRLGSQKP